jgi:hypothetical protein
MCGPLESRTVTQGLLSAACGSLIPLCWPVLLACRIERGGMVLVNPGRAAGARGLPALSAHSPYGLGYGLGVGHLCA